MRLINPGMRYGREGSMLLTTAAGPLVEVYDPDGLWWTGRYHREPDGSIIGQANLMWLQTIKGELAQVGWRWPGGTPISADVDIAPADMAPLLEWLSSLPSASALAELYPHLHEYRVALSEHLATQAEGRRRQAGAQAERRRRRASRRERWQKLSARARR